MSAGAFIVLVGPDGVGKTTVAAALTQATECRSVYFHLRPKLNSALPTGPPESSPDPPPKHFGPGSRPRG